MMKESNYETIKFINGELELEVTISPYEETVWMNQEQIVKLFNSNKQNVSFHINNILNEGELELSTVKEILTVRLEGNRKVTRKIKYYNLDMIISIGYRINSKIGIMFRKWANKILHLCRLVVWLIRYLKPFHNPQGSIPQAFYPNVQT